VISLRGDAVCHPGRRVGRGLLLAGLAVLAGGWILGEWWGWPPGVAGLIAGAVLGVAGMVVTGKSDDARKKAELALPAGVPLRGPPPGTCPPVPLAQPAACLVIPGGVVRALAFSPDGRRLAASGDSGTVTVWDLTTARHPVRVNASAQPGSLAALAFSRDALVAVTAGDAGTVTVWDLPGPAGPGAARPAAVLACWAHPRRRLSFPHRRKPVSAISVSAGGRLLATAAANGTVAVWDIATVASPSRTAAVACRGTVASAAFSARGQLLATGTPGKVIVWDLADPAHPARTASLRPLRKNFFDMDGPVICALAFSPDGRLLATAAVHDTVFTVSTGPGPTTREEVHDSAIVLWDVSDPARPAVLTTLAERGRDRVKTITGPPHTLTGHTAPARALAFSPDSRLLATGSDDTTVLVWDITAPASPRHTLTLSHPAAVTTLAFSPDGATLASGSATTTRLWQI
jgi:WD40 repeat protein